MYQEAENPSKLVVPSGFRNIFHVQSVLLSSGHIELVVFCVEIIYPFWKVIFCEVKKLIK